jgi:hypothetical protein
MIASVHLADVGRRKALRLLSARRAPSADGMRYAALTAATPLSPSLLRRPRLGRIGLIAAWDDDRALDRFLATDPLAGLLAPGWRARLQPTHIFGAWPQLDGLLDGADTAMADTEPAAVLTIGRLRLSQIVRFLRASAGAEGLALREPALLASTALARPPGLVATFSLWQSTGAMRAYARGDADAAHRAASQAHAARPFHHASASTEGDWDGENPLAVSRPAVPSLSSA